MAAKQSWNLRRFARFTPTNAKETPSIPWKVYDCAGKKSSPIVLTIQDTGYLVVMQGKESLDTVHLINSKENIKVNQKSENLMFRFTLKGESRMTRLQFHGRNKEEATKQCASALKKVMQYLPGSSLEDASQPPNQTEAQCSNHVRREHQPVQGSLPMKKLAQYFMGVTALTLPEVYCHSHLTNVDFEPILRVFLLDPSFHSFVEKVEGELKTLMKE